MLQRRGRGFLQSLLGDLEIPQPVDERRQHPRPIGAEDTIKRLADTLAYGWPFGSPASQIGRTSTAPLAAVGCFAASSSA